MIIYIKNTNGLDMNNKTHAIEVMVRELELPESAYEKAKDRYESIGKWFGDPSVAESAKFEPKIYPQGSFRLGTAIKPLKDEHYDLDISCSITSSLNHGNTSQNDLKNLLKTDLDKYRNSKSIMTPLKDKKRCLRLEYCDDINFHIDLVPSITARAKSSERVRKLLLDSAATTELADSVASHAVSITDNERLPQYFEITNDWLLSNPEGYAIWFDEQSKKASEFMNKKILIEDQLSTVVDLPNHKWNSPLQQVVKLLKRHRDVMFSDNEDGKPISIILTTLAGLAYEGETDVKIAIKNVLEKIPALVSEVVPRIPNPVNDKEDFTDKWDTDEGIKLELEKNFWAWHKKIKEDLIKLESTLDPKELQETISSSYNISVKDIDLSNQIQINRLLSKAALVGAGAMTSSTATLGNTGVVNKDHKFFGSGPIDKA